MTARGACRCGKEHAKVSPGTHEPTGALDSQSGEQVLDLLADLNKEHGTTLVVVTHDQSIADLADHTVCLQDGKLS